MRPGIAAGESGAGDGVRTRDTKLGKLVLYQLSYARNLKADSSDKPKLIYQTACEIIASRFYYFKMILELLRLPRTSLASAAR